MSDLSNSVAKTQTVVGESQCSSRCSAKRYPVKPPQPRM